MQDFRPLIGWTRAICLSFTTVVVVACGASNSTQRLATYNTEVAKQDIVFVVPDSLTILVQERFIRWIRCHTSYSIQHVSRDGGYAGPSVPAEYWMSIANIVEESIKVMLSVAKEAEGGKYRRECIYYLQYGIAPPPGHPLHSECLDEG